MNCMYIYTGIIKLIRPGQTRRLLTIETSDKYDLKLTKTLNIVNLKITCWVICVYFYKHSTQGNMGSGSKPCFM